MTSLPRRFNLFQRLLHWLMAACIIAMLFIGVGMVSTITPKYLPLILAHKTLGVALLILVLIRLALRLFYGAPPLPADLPTTDEIRSETISPCAVWPDDRHAVAWSGDALGRGLSGGPVRRLSGFRRCCRKAIPCTRCCGTRISISASRFSRWCCCISLQGCSTH